MTGLATGIWIAFLKRVTEDEEMKIKLGENENKSADKLVEPRFLDETLNVNQGPSGPGNIEKRDDKEDEGHQPEETMEQDPDQAGKDVDKASTCGVSSLEFKFLDDYEVETKTLEAQLTQRRMKPPRSNLPQPL